MKIMDFRSFEGAIPGGLGARKRAFWASYGARGCPRGPWRHYNQILEKYKFSIFEVMVRGWATWTDLAKLQIRAG